MSKLSKLLKWSAPVVAFAVVIALASVRVDAEDAAAKGKVTGTVMQEDGKPAANASVKLMNPPPKKPKPDGDGSKPAPQAEDGAAKPADGDKPARPDGGRPPKLPPVAEGTTDAEGKFTLDAPAGTYLVTVNLKGMGRTQKKIDVKAGETTDVGTLTLKKPAPKKDTAPAT